MMKNTKKGKVWSSIFFTSAAIITYFGFVGIEAKATEIEKIGNLIEEKIQNTSFQTDEKIVNQPTTDNQVVTRSELKNDPIILTYIKGEKSSGSFKDKKDNNVYFYMVDENLRVSIYNRYGILQNEKEFEYELKAVSKAEKEKLYRNELNENSSFQTDYKDRKEFEKYAEAYSFVEKKARPKEGITEFYNTFISAFNEKGITTKDTLVSTRLKFIVEKDGSFSNIFAVGSNDENASNEAIRVLKTMPKWIPAENEGEIVRSTFTMPIKIKLNQ